MTRPVAAAVVRLLVLGTVVFTLAAITGGALGYAAPANEHGPPLERLAAGERYRATGVVDPSFAHSMVYSGATALAVSTAGLVIVAHRRRAW